MFRRLSIIVAIIALGVSAAAPPASALIMKDGNVCDPIRHMGC